MSPVTPPIAERGHVAFLDRFYGVQRHFYDATRWMFLFGRDRALDHIRAGRPGSILELGCGTARNLARLRHWLPDADLYGADASVQMLHSARRRRVRLFQTLAENVTGPAQFGRPTGFDAVLFSYSLSMIADWRQAIEAALRCLAPGGELHVVDFWDFARWPGPIRRLMVRHLQAHHVRADTELADWLASRGAVVEPVAGRWAFLARIQRGR